MSKSLEQQQREIQRRNALLDSAAEKPDNEPLTDDEWLAVLIHNGYTDDEDMLDYDCD